MTSTLKNPSTIPRDFPLRTNKKCVEVQGIATDLLCSSFEDKLFIIVTQYQKLGNLIELKRESSPVGDIMIQPVQTQYSTRILLGNDEPLTHVLAKNLIGQVTSPKPIVLAMALKDVSRETVLKLSQEVKELVNS